MTTERATFSLELRDGISAPAQDAVGELTRLKEGMAEGVARLREMQAAMQRLKAGGVQPASEAMQRLRAEIDAQRRSNASMQQGILSLGGAFDGVRRETEGAKDGVDGMIGSLKAMGGPLGAIGERLGRLRAGMASAPMLVGGLALGVVLAGVAVAAIAVARAAAEAAIELGRYALTSADARRTEMLRLEGLMTLREYQRGATGSASELMAAIDRVSASSATSREGVSRYGEQLYRAGLRGSELSGALEAAAMSASVQGDESAAAFVRQARAAHAAGRSVRGLADDVRSRLGGVARRQALGLDVQARHLRESFAHLFDGLRLDGFLRGMREVLQIFDQQHAVGRALATLARVIFQPMLDGAGQTGPALRAFFEQLTIHALDVAIGVLEVRNAILRTFGRPTVSQVETVRFALAAATLAAATLGLALIPVVATMAIVGAAIALAVYPLYMMVDAIANANRVLEIAGLTWSSAGRLLVDGFIGGITSRFATVATVVRGLATQATDALRGALDIHSPSRVFAELGSQIPAGLAVGVEQGAPAARAAVDGVVGMPSARPAGGSSGPTIGELHIHMDGAGEGAREAAQSIHDELVRLLSGVGSEVGA